MDHYSLATLFFIFSTLTNAQSDIDTSVTKSTWFWPLLGVCLALLLSVFCTLIVLSIICYIKHKSNDTSNQSSFSSDSSSSRSTTPVEHRRRRRHSHPQRSHYAGALPSPPPPYTTSEQPQNVFMSPSLPPPYEFHINETVSAAPPTIIETQPTEITVNPTTTSEVSVLTSSSMQTFQA